MRYIKDQLNAVHGFDETDAAQLSLMNQLFYTNAVLNPGCTDVTGSWPPAQTQAEQWAAYQDQALAALQHSDITMHRILESVILGLVVAWSADEQAWVTYRRQLRAILSQAQPGTIPVSLPTKPPYPAQS